MILGEKTTNNNKTNQNYKYDGLDILGVKIHSLSKKKVQFIIKTLRYHPVIFRINDLNRTEFIYQDTGNSRPLKTENSKLVTKLKNSSLS